METEHLLILLHQAADGVFIGRLTEDGDFGGIVPAGFEPPAEGLLCGSIIRRRRRGGIKGGKRVRQDGHSGRPVQRPGQFVHRHGAGKRKAVVLAFRDGTGGVEQKDPHGVGGPDGQKAPEIPPLEKERIDGCAGVVAVFKAFKKRVVVRPVIQPDNVRLGRVRPGVFGIFGKPVSPLLQIEPGHKERAVGKHVFDVAPVAPAGRLKKRLIAGHTDRARQDLKKVALGTGKTDGQPAGVRRVHPQRLGGGAALQNAFCARNVLQQPRLRRAGRGIDRAAQRKHKVVGGHRVRKAVQFFFHCLGGGGGQVPLGVRAQPERIGQSVGAHVPGFGDARLHGPVFVQTDKSLKAVEHGDRRCAFLNDLRVERTAPAGVDGKIQRHDRTFAAGRKQR